MKIGFAGAHGTGKTSVAEAMVKDQWFKDRDWKFVPSTSRAAVEDGWKVNRKADPLSQLLTTVSRVVIEYQAEKDCASSIVTDRTLIDSLAYTAYQLNHVWELDSKLYFKVSYGLVEKQMESYDHVFYFPTYWAPKSREDGLRDEDVEYQQKIDEFIVMFLEVMQIPVFKMPNINSTERVQFVKDCILVD